MNKKLLLVTFIGIFLIGCCSKDVKYKKVNADDLIENYSKYENVNVETEGFILHVCGVDGMKMKLKTDKGEIIKLVPSNNIEKFSSDYYKAKIRVFGKVLISKTDKEYVDKIEADKAILCHIDNTPCKDTAWAKRQIENGRADSLSIKDVERLRSKMNKLGTDFITEITIVVDKIEVLEKTE